MRASLTSSKSTLYTVLRGRPRTPPPALRRRRPVGGALTYARASPGTDPPTSPSMHHHSPTNQRKEKWSLISNIANSRRQSPTYHPGPWTVLHLLLWLKILESFAIAEDVMSVTTPTFGAWSKNHKGNQYRWLGISLVNTVIHVIYRPITWVGEKRIITNFFWSTRMQRSSIAFEFWI
jgi:hypothetical protein